MTTFQADIWKNEVKCTKRPFADLCPQWLFELPRELSLEVLLKNQSNITKQSLIYPGAGYDWSTIHETPGLTYSYIYYDTWMYEREDFVSELKACKPVEGYEDVRCIGVVEFQTEAFPKPRIKFDATGYFRSPGGLPEWLDKYEDGLGAWAVYEIGEGNRISLLMLCQESIQGIYNLYNPNDQSPTIFHLRDCTFGGNSWGNFGRPYQELLIQKYGFNWPEFLLLSSFDQYGFKSAGQYRSFSPYESGFYGHHSIYITPKREMRSDRNLYELCESLEAFKPDLKRYVEEERIRQEQLRQERNELARLERARINQERVEHYKLVQTNYDAAKESLSCKINSYVSIDADENTQGSSEDFRDYFEERHPELINTDFYLRLQEGIGEEFEAESIKKAIKEIVKVKCCDEELALFLLGHLKRRDENVYEEIVNWVLSNTEHEGLPFGASRQGANTLQEYNSKIIMQKQFREDTKVLRKKLSLEFTDNRYKLRGNHQRAVLTGARDDHVSALKHLDSDERISIFLKDEEYPADYYPKFLADDITSKLSEMPDELLIRLLARLRGKQSRYWRKCKRELSDEYYHRSGEAVPWQS